MEEGVLFFNPKKYPGNIFSNFSKHSIKYNGKVYQTAEHLFQAMKFMGPNATQADKEYASLIAKQNTPNKAKRLARQKGIGGGYQWQKDLNKLVQKYKNTAKIRPDWEKVKDRIMYQIVLLKVSQHKAVMEELINTGDKFIAENSPNDDYWGLGKNGIGRNQLGKIYMKIRSELF